MRGRKVLAWWLFAIAGLIFAMVVVGGITRLTGSGLSIMEWAPLRGTLPPLSKEEWIRLFALYRQTAQFHQLNPTMTLDGFQDIFWWEYVHRLLGRLIGLVVAVPFLYFLFTGRIRGRLALGLLAILLLGALQGALGWYMVASGFENRLEVSHYRLAAHLLAALLLYGAVLWTGFDQTASEAAFVSPPHLRAGFLILLILIFVEMGMGALVAGLHGGLIYNSFPTMGGHWWPAELEAGGWTLVDNPAGAQFLHRLLAAFILLMTLFLARAARRTSLWRRTTTLLALAVLQIGLGIATLLFIVPVPLAVLHQANALLVFGAALFCVHGAWNRVHGAVRH
ncbi:MAG TPA: COX15/CtaA family protein [Dongiaceae bacterium]|jgi:cytochrome c oxidase assembly protein subunit 15|nr:COX15/CtaA family protein [Dongiaceae bacterium]